MSGIENMRQSNDKLSTSEYAKEWTEKNPNSKLSTINNKLNSIRNKPSSIIMLQNLIKNCDYREFQKKIGCSLNECDGKLGKKSLRYFGLYLDKELKSNAVLGNSHTELGSLQGFNHGSIENLADTLTIQHHEQTYLQRYESLSEGDFNKLFSGKERLGQGQLGDCYLVSGIFELARTQCFDTLMRTSIQRMKRENGDMGYQIKIPLGEPSGRKIIIKDSEISVAKIKGATGYKLLELAYAKNKLRPNNNRGNVYKPITSSELKKIAGGRTSEVLQTFLGKKNISFNDFGTEKIHRAHKTLNQCNHTTKINIENFLKHYDPKIGNKFASLSSRIGSSDNESYTVGNKRIYCKHAYSISKIQKDSSGNIKYITVHNPRNKEGDGKNYQQFTLTEFYQGFSSIQQGKINTSNFLA